MELLLLREASVEMVGVELRWWGQCAARCIGWLGGISLHSNHIPEPEHWDTQAIKHASLISHSLHLHHHRHQHRSCWSVHLGNFISGVGIKSDVAQTSSFAIYWILDGGE